jgi:hypothetical protein
MEQFNNPAPTPKDATKATEEQPRLQEKLAHQSDDPDAPGIKMGTSSLRSHRSTANCVPRSSAAWVATAQLPTF